uniref:Fe2OG dioxygenase domain-containing protein n=1 Tax=Pseudictyota dubia TaxID=2749911 RepID=A0A7R9W3W3_9STRA|mmetsp:Transcript_32652/g.60066  ORF Transcript_32652/g.60066 Transcript_32652/m.60066 type:complete len:507 (+) Transcript_32652:71-1591(+)
MTRSDALALLLLLMRTAVASPDSAPRVVLYAGADADADAGAVASTCNVHNKSAAAECSAPVLTEHSGSGGEDDDEEEDVEEENEERMNKDVNDDEEAEDDSSEDEDEEENGSDDEETSGSDKDEIEQVMFPDDHRLDDALLDRLDRMEKYLEEAGKDDEELAAVMPRCKNKHELCLQWATYGECEESPDFMANECPAACLNCDSLLYQRRCPYDPSAPRALQKGDLHKMFHRIVTEERYKKYKPRVWSHPYWTSPSHEETEDDSSEDEETEGDSSDDDVEREEDSSDDEEASSSNGDDKVWKDVPWVVSLENFLTDEEADRIIELGYEEKFERSDDGGEYMADGTFKTYFIDGRTSWNAWCDECYGDEKGGQAVLDKIQDVTSINQTHFDNLQILRYEKGQHYHLHHDYDSYEVPRQPGPRILTFFLYLSDVEEGGGTNFPDLNLTFTPRKGRAVIWPNVLNEDPEKEDERTQHQALPVVNGTKYAANAWIHLHDYQGPLHRDCDA